MAGLIVDVPCTNAKEGLDKDILFVEVNPKANLEKVKIRKYDLSKLQKKKVKRKHQPVTKEIANLFNHFPIKIKLQNFTHIPPVS